MSKIRKIRIYENVKNIPIRDEKYFLSLTTMIMLAKPEKIKVIICRR